MLSFIDAFIHPYAFMQNEYTTAVIDGSISMATNLLISQLKRNTKRGFMGDGINASRFFVFDCYYNAMMVSSIVVHILEKSNLLLLAQPPEQYPRAVAGTQHCSDNGI